MPHVMKYTWAPLWASNAALTFVCRTILGVLFMVPAYLHVRNFGYQTSLVSLTQKALFSRSIADYVYMQHLLHLAATDISSAKTAVS